MRGTNWLGRAIAIAAMASTAAGAVTSVAAMRWHYRALLLFAPAEDARVAGQRAIIAGAEAGYGERDLRVVTIIGSAVSGASDGAAALRRRYHVDPAAFALILIGKDGGEKLRSAEPLPAHRLFATIDAMPMRRDELRR